MFTQRRISIVVLFFLVLLTTMPAQAGTSPSPDAPQDFLDDVPLVPLSPIQINSNYLTPLSDGTFQISVPFENENQKFRITITGSDANDIVDYVNNARVYFEADVFGRSELDDFYRSEESFLAITQATAVPEGDSIIDDLRSVDFEVADISQQLSIAALEVEIALVTGAIGGYDEYAVYFQIDPLLARGDVHYYRVVEASSISVTGRLLDGDNLSYGMRRQYQNNFFISNFTLSQNFFEREYFHSIVRETGNREATAKYDALFTSNQDVYYEVLGGFSQEELCEELDEDCLRIQFPQPLNLREVSSCENGLDNQWFTADGDNPIYMGRNGYTLEIGAYSGATAYPDTWGSLQEQRFTDHRIIAEVTVPELNNSNGIASTGIWYRYQDGSNFLAFVITNRGEYRIARFQSNTYSELTPNRASEVWLDYDGIFTEIGRANTLEIVTEGNQHEFYINNNRVARIEDNTWSDGRVAFYGSAEGYATPATFVLSSLQICY